MLTKTIQNCNIAGFMNLLYISYDGLTDPLGQSQILPYVIGLKKLGFHYTILSFEKKSRFRRNGDEVSELLKDLSIQWIPEYYTKYPPVISTIYDILKMRKSIKKAHSECAFDVVHCRSYISMFAAFPIARKLNLKVVFDMRGFWVDERIEGKIWNIKNPIFNFLFHFLKNKEKKWLIESDLIISLTENGKKQIKLLYPEVTIDRIHIIPCCADESLFDPLKINETKLNEIRNSLKIKSTDKVLGYIGSTGTWYLTDEMMKTFLILKEKNIVNKFLWITTEKESVVKGIGLKSSVNPEDIIVVFAERNIIPHYISLLELGIFYILPSFSKTASSPTKLAELLLMGKAVICNTGIGDMEQLFSKNGIGICHYLDQIRNLDFSKLDPAKADEIRSTGLAAFSLKQGIEKYQQALNSLT